MLTIESILAVDSAGPRATYAEYVRDMEQIGIHSYWVWVGKHDRVFYDINGAEYVIAGTFPVVEIETKFVLSEIKRAIQSVNAGLTDYPMFLREIAQAGVCKYFADFPSRTIRYIGINEDDVYQEVF